MVEGHSVHRVATRHRQRLVGKAFQATSPNGRFSEGAKAIDGKVFYRCEAIGKNLFAFFKHNSETQEEAVVVHVHFGMAGNWAVYDHDSDNDDDEAVIVPEPTSTNRLRLVHHANDSTRKQALITADLSAMTVNHGGMDLYWEKKSKLGQDPLREDADPEVLWNKVSASKKSIGALIMDQSFFTGPGNIYRAEILFKAGIHPDRPGQDLERHEFDLVWMHTVALLQRGYETGSILTVDPDEAQRLGKPNLRRYIYNASHCPRCETRIQVWTIASRTCYACPQCQPQQKSESTKGVVATPRGNKTKTKSEHVPFNSHCAREPVGTRLEDSGPERLTVKEIKAELARLGVLSIPKSAKKAVFVQMLLDEQSKAAAEAVAVTPPSSNSITNSPVNSATIRTTRQMLVSSEDAAAEKAMANESLAVEHIAELAPAQARRARARAQAVVVAAVKDEADAKPVQGTKRQRVKVAKDTTVAASKKQRTSTRRKK